MSDTPREPDQDDATTGPAAAERSTHDRGAEPVTAPSVEAASPAEAADNAEATANAGDASPAKPADNAEATANAGDANTAEAADDAEAAGRADFPGSVASWTTSSSGDAGPSEAGSDADPGGTADRGVATAGRRRMFGLGRSPDGPPDESQRRRRRRFVVAIAVGAAIIVLALCASALSVVSALHGARDRAGAAREARRQGELGCLDLERRLNRLIPPGATTGPAARATAIQDENAAVRIYVTGLHDSRAQDGWRQLLDARTVYADALDRQAKSRTPAFYVAPATGDGQAVADELAGESPAPCAGPIRRLAAPDL